VGVAEDPPGTEWVYVNESKGDEHGLDEIVRYQVDNLSKKELVWNKTPSNDKWEFTRDGKYGASGLPWPRAGWAALPNGEFKNFGEGCTPGLANDLSAVFHMIAMGHRGIVVYNKDGSNPRQILFADAPGVAGTPDPQFWWVSFARYDPRFFTFSGPHPSLGYKPSKGDIYFCQFNEKRDGVAKWVRLCDTPELDTGPYAWIDSQKTPAPLDQIAIDASIAAQMGAAAKEPVHIVIKNDSEKAFAGTALLAPPQGWTAEPARTPFTVAKGAEQTVTLYMVRSASAAAGEVPADIELQDEQGKTMYWARLKLKIGAPLELLPQTPRTIDDAHQPINAVVRNISGQPISGTLRVELEGQEKVPPVEQAFGPIPPNSEALVEAVVPGLKLLGHDYMAKYSASVNGMVVSAQLHLAAQRYWLVLGPFQNPPGPGWHDGDYNSFNGKGYDYAFEPEKGTDLAKEYFMPKDLGMPGDFANVDPKAPIRWRTAPSQEKGFVDLTLACAPNTQAVAFALMYVKSPDARKAVLSVGADDCFKVWANGKQVIGHPGYQAAHPDQERAEIQLQAGWNEVLLKVGTGMGGWGFFCDLLGPDGQPMSGLIYGLKKD
jgi:hypothetical protein